MQVEYQYAVLLLQETNVTQEQINAAAERLRLAIDGLVVCAGFGHFDTGMAVETLLASPEVSEVLNADRSPRNPGDVLATGTVVVFENGTEQTVVVLGDVTGTGEVGMEDVAAVLDHIRGRNPLWAETPYYAAANVSGTGIDLRALNRLLTYYRGRLPALRPENAAP